MKASTFGLRRKLATMAAATSVVAASVLVATGTSGADTGGFARAQAVVSQYSKIPTSIGINIKLKKAPKKGIKVAFLECPSASCLALGISFVQAAKALHWHPTTVTYDAANPGAALQSAINAGNKYIGSSSISLAAITPQLAQMKAKKIGWFESYESDVPKFTVNGLYGQASNPSSATNEGKLIADEMIVNSNSNVHALFVSLPIYPVLVSQGTAAQAELARNCSACTMDTLGISVAQLVAGQIPALVVAYLQTHSNINYLYFSFAGVDTGVPAALQAAGLTARVKIVGTQGTAPEMQAIQAGTQVAWSVLPENFISWSIVDWMARLSEGQLIQRDFALNGGSAMYLANTVSLATKTLGYQDLNDPAGVWGGPTGYQNSFKKLWGVK